MHQTFEEIAGQHIDGLYHGARFLNGGEESPAEDLVLWTLTGAFREFRQMETAGGSERWLEGRLVGVFLAREGRSPIDENSLDGSLDEAPLDADISSLDWSNVRSSAESSSGSMEIDPEALFRAAAIMPPLARAAIWLVIFRRWSYDEAARVLDTDVDGLKDVLQYRHVLLAALMQVSPARSRTDQGGSN
jgi:DNA-directed RNA polymerase specialized sigma24 family protein